MVWLGALFESDTVVRPASWRFGVCRGAAGGEDEKSHRTRRALPLSCPLMSNDQSTQTFPPLLPSNSIAIPPSSALPTWLLTRPCGHPGNRQGRRKVPL
jgi:hypothetical protein